MLCDCLGIIGEAPSNVGISRFGGQHNIHLNEFSTLSTTMSDPHHDQNSPDVEHTARVSPVPDETEAGRYRVSVSACPTDHKSARTYRSQVTEEA